MVNFVEYVPLKQVSEKIFSGVSQYTLENLRKEFQGQEIPFLNIRDIENNSINLKNNSYLTVKINYRTEKFIVHSGDVLLTSRGTQIKIAVVPEIFPQAIISANFLAIRPTKDINPFFLAHYFRSPAGQKAIRTQARGTSQILLTISAVEEIKVPMPSLDVQEKLVAFINSIDEQYKMSIEISNLYKVIGNQIFSEWLHNKEEKSV